LNDEQRDLFNMLIFERAHKLRAFQRADRVHIFRSTAEEVNTMPLIEYAWGIGIEVAVPRVVRSSQTLQHIVVTRDTEWQQGAFGILEPRAHENEILLADSDFGATAAIIVPVVAFDRTCHRLGYGKGYYDRFLANTTATTIGVAYERQRLEKIPTESHDVALHAIATEERWYTP
jgi:5-formyltetrahydrofolate cyclo-ligase